MCNIGIIKFNTDNIAFRNYNDAIRTLIDIRDIKKTSPLLAVRFFIVRKARSSSPPYLSSLTRNNLIKFGVWTTAQCAFNCKLIPGIGETDNNCEEECGFYSYHSLDIMKADHSADGWDAPDSVPALVNIAGRIVGHKYGYRSQFLRVIGLFLKPGLRTSTTNILRSYGEKHNTPIENISALQKYLS